VFGSCGSLTGATLRDDSDASVPGGAPVEWGSVRVLDPVRVALDVTPCIGRQTGIGRFVEGLQKALANDDGIVVVPLAMSARNRSVVAPAQRLPLPARPMRSVWERIDQPTIELWTGPIDVVHGTNYIVPPSRSARLVSVHDLTAVRYPEMCTPDVVRMPRFLRRSLGAGTHVHTDSAFVAREVHEEFGVPLERVHTIAPGIPIDRASLDTARQRQRPLGGRPYVLALGTVEPRKDLPLLVRSFVAAASDLADFSLVIAGADGWGANELNEELSRVPQTLRHRIIREVDVNDVRRSELLVHAEVLVYPSRYEGFGFPPLEAMVARTPVIATTAGSLPEVLGDAAELVPVNDSDALAIALVSVLTDAGRRNELVHRGVQRAHRYDWAKAALEFAALYRSLAEQDPGVR
jgi:glycosyltransferase involved in cell wall biosynthesis